IVIPIAIIMAGTGFPTLIPPSPPPLGTPQRIGAPKVALIISLGVAFLFFAFLRGGGFQNTPDIIW
ncbi:transporter, partial [Escherichia coli]|nr:transporter [Escherichia coli]